MFDEDENFIRLPEIPFYEVRVDLIYVLSVPDNTIIRDYIHTDDTSVDPRSIILLKFKSTFFVNLVSL